VFRCRFATPSREDDVGTSRFELFGVLALGLVACGASPRNAPAIVGTWRSGDVHLTGPGRDEVYRFQMVLTARDDDEMEGVLDLEYASAGRPGDRREIRQEVVLVVDSAIGMLTLTGRNPVLLAGPVLVGVYEPDELTCSLPRRDSPDRLACRWGSDAHGEPPEVVFVRVEVGGSDAPPSAPSHERR
jgi:hypothetical protein